MSLLEKRAKDLSKSLSRTIVALAGQASPESVHRFRLTVRRMESLIAFVGPDLGRKQRRAIAHLGELRRRAGKVRDWDVQIDLLGTIANRSTVSDRRQLADAVKRRRARHAKRLRCAVDRLLDTNFLAHLRRVGEKAGTARPGADLPPLEQARRHLSGLAGMFRSQQPVAPRVLHKVRIRLKMIRYLAELAPATPERQRLLASLKTGQDALGAWRDWEQLAKTAEDLFGDRLNCPLLVEIRALFAAKRGDATVALAWLLPANAEPRRKQPARSGGFSALARPA